MHRPRSGPVHRRRAVAARGHHQVVHHSEPLTAARCGDGPEGCLLGFRGAESPVAAVADEDGARRPARLGSEEHRMGRKPRGLDPADGDDRMPDEAVAVIEEEHQRDVFPAVPEQITSELCCCCRSVDPTGERQRCFHLRMHGGSRPANTPDKRSEVVERSCRDHRGALP